MHRDHKIFLKGVRKGRRLLVTYSSPDLECNLSRWCAPKEYSPDIEDARFKQYHFWDKNRAGGDTDLILSADQIVSMKLTQFDFKVREFAELIQNAKQHSKQLTTVG